MVGAIIYIISLFAIVVMHELSHALTARRFGIMTRDIILLPIGGVARLERMPRDPRQELLVALAGPAFNIVFALVLWGLLIATGGPPQWEEVTVGVVTSGRTFLLQLVAANVMLALFNLLPAFPMDGGRVLRATIALVTHDHARATTIAARVGRAFALVFALVGLFVFHPPNLFLVLIALFVWLGAVSESAAAQTSATLEDVKIQNLMVRKVETLKPTDTLSRALELTLTGFQQDFPVVDEKGDVVGVLTRADLLRGLSEHGPNAPVPTAMHKGFEVVAPDDPVEVALARLRTCDCNALPVVRGKELLGVLTLDNVGEYVMIQAALRGSKG
jgi:Zn-dependent protease/predicted transcriptional regulator